MDAIADGCLGYDHRNEGPLRDPATGRVTKYYSQAIVCDLTFAFEGAKDNDEFRKSYALLDGIPIDQWPERARTYPIDDTRNALIAALVQTGHLGRDAGIAGLKTAPRRRARNLHAMADIAYAAFALHLGACWGFGVDQTMVSELGDRVLASIEAGTATFKDCGFIRDDGTGNKAIQKRALVLAYGPNVGPCPVCDGTGKVASATSGNPINDKACDGTGLDIESLGFLLPRTEKGAVSTARDVLVDSGDDTLIEFAEWGETAKIVSTYVPALVDGLPLRPNVPLKNERVSYSGIVQTMPRKGAVRDCVVARPGTLISSVDFTGVELCTLAQTCIDTVGFSNLGEVLNSGSDAHSVLGADVCGRTYDEFIALKNAGDRQIADYRQAAKWGNFGFGGGMGEPKFVITNRKAPGMTTKAPDGKEYKGVRFCILVGGRPRCGEEKLTEWKGRPTTPVCAACVDAAVIIRTAWFTRWAEMRPYFNFINDVVESVGAITHFVSGVVRGGVTFTEAANGMFSSRAAIGAKRAFVAVTRAAYLARPGSVLYGTRPIAFIHDEALCEHPTDRAGDAAREVCRIMVDEMQKVTPDVIIRSSPALMRRLYKGAEETLDSAGNLIPWEPNE